MWPNRYSDLPNPWTTRDVLSIVGVLALAAGSLLVGVVAVISGELASLKYCLLFALMMVLVAALGVVARRRRSLTAAIRTVDRDGTPATEIRYSPAQFALLNASAASFGAFFLLAAVDTFTYLYPDDGAATAVIPTAIGLFFASFSLSAAVGRLRRGALTLSAQGITQRGWSFESHLDWSGIAGIKLESYGYPTIVIFGYANADWTRRPTASIWRVDRLPPAPMIEVDCRNIGVRPEALFSYLSSYVDNPSVRTELGTPAALARALHIPHT
ncbi:hypothetical protein [Mycolicibacterium fortuitum]|uniref:hypothetical protein n=1 Tax=Mycolicibacterium fortuitum TaxID=1766 RepID=UPI00261DE680|nr:hypothetical protein [Mycolicibacterium fortuitum]